MVEMPRKIKKDQDDGELVSDSPPNITQKNNNSTGLFSIPGLFVVFSAKALSDCESVRSPTSPLDSRVFSGLASSWLSHRSDLETPQKQRKCWCSQGVGLGIVGSLADVETHSLQNFGGKSESKNILLGSQLKFNPQCKGNHRLQEICSSVTSRKSLPTNHTFSTPTGLKPGFQHLGSSQFAVESDASLSETTDPSICQFCSSESVAVSTDLESAQKASISSDFNINKNAGSCVFPLSEVGDHHFSISSTHNRHGGVSVNTIELSEDYTCIFTHGPNPKMKHIYGDFVLEEGHMPEVPACNKRIEWEIEAVSPSCMPFSLMDDFLRSCYGCGKKLLEGEDIYMYRGEKAFCTPDCRIHEIMLDEGIPLNSFPPTSQSSSHDEISSLAETTQQDRRLVVVHP